MRMICSMDGTMVARTCASRHSPASSTMRMRGAAALRSGRRLAAANVVKKGQRAFELRVRQEKSSPPFVVAPMILAFDRTSFLR